MSSAASPNIALDVPFEAQPEAAVPGHVTKHLVSGTSALGLGVVIERGMGFLANLLAARFGGASTFGAYSLAISTANNISTYAAGGIGSTAARFSGKYPRGTAGYTTLSRVLAIVSLASAAIAAIGLWAGAGPIAHLLEKESLTQILRWAAFSAAGIILLECARGFFVGQRRLAALVLLSGTVGVGMLTLLPLAAARLGAVQMIVCQGAVTTAAVALCVVLYKPLGLASPALALPSKAVTPMLREVWSFGFVQLAGLIGMNISGWWLMSLVARSDSSLVQMSFFAIAHQLRNIVGLGPGLLTESSYAVMAEREGEKARTPNQVMAVCTYASTVASLALAAAGILVVPWGLTLLYGRTYSAAAVTTAIALATAVVHMGNAPAAARLTIVSIRMTGVINTVWAIFVALAGTAFLLHGGSASKGAAIYLAGHLLSSTLVLLVLWRRDCVPNGMARVFWTASLTSVALALLAIFRDSHPAYALPVTALMAALCGLAFYSLVALGRKHHWLPNPASVRRLIETGRSAGEKVLSFGRTRGV